MARKLKIKIPKLLLILLTLGLFLRLLRFNELYRYNHEQDLQAWIVKDILVDRHPRLIGQETSIPGLFIGPLYYYLLVPFFALLSMDPRASAIPVVIISLAGVASIYFVLKRLYGKRVGIIGAFIFAVSPTIVFLDRWTVPTHPTLLWTLWFYYCLVKFSKGKYEVTPILIILLGFIWHIHIALFPLLILVPVAIFFGSKEKGKRGKISKANIFYSLVILGLLLLPLFAFEFRHNFQQVKGILNMNQTREYQAVELRQGYYKFEVITEYVNRVLWSLLLYRLNPKYPMIFRVPFFLLIFMAFVYFLYKKEKITEAQVAIFYLWILITVFGQLSSKRIISDYYFNNLLVPSVVIFSLLTSYIFERTKVDRGKYTTYLGVLYFIVSFLIIYTKKKPFSEFMDRKNAVDFIADDYQASGYPCVGINYIGEIGVEYGYRYFFWWKNVNQIAPAGDIPVYNIVQPHYISKDEVAFIAGEVGVILPERNNLEDPSVCTRPERQLLPLNGFVN